MPTVEKVRGGEVLVRGIDTRFSVGDRADVSDELAAYLCEERGDFERVEENDDLEPGDTVCTCDPGEACDRCGGDCPTVKTDGEVCGGNRPCQYHDDQED